MGSALLQAIGNTALIMQGYTAVNLNYTSSVENLKSSIKKANIKEALALYPDLKEMPP